MSTRSVRDATVEDAEAIARIGGATFYESFGHSMPAEDMDAYLRRTFSTFNIAQEMDDDKNYFYVATETREEKERVVGFLQMKMDSTEPCIPEEVVVCEIHRIYVSHEQVGSGIGRRLMDAGLAWGETYLASQRAGNSNRKKSAIWLGVWEDNLKARRFYSRFGFEAIGVHDFVMGQTTQTDHILIKYIS